MNSSDIALISALISLPFLCADNVGDNVGDIAGMGADLFGSFAESTCAALVISSVSTLGHEYVAMSYPLMVSAVGILVCFVTTFVATDIRPARIVSEIEPTLKYQLIISTILATPVSLRPLHQQPPPRRLDTAHSVCGHPQESNLFGVPRSCVHRTPDYNVSHLEGRECDCLEHSSQLANLAMSADLVFV